MSLCKNTKIQLYKQNYLSNDAFQKPVKYSLNIPLFKVKKIKSKDKTITVISGIDSNSKRKALVKKLKLNNSKSKAFKSCFSVSLETERDTNQLLTSTNKWFNQTNLPFTKAELYHRTMFNSINQNSYIPSDTMRSVEDIVKDQCIAENIRITTLLREKVLKVKKDLPPLIIKKINIGSTHNPTGSGNKFMGEKYDPFNYHITITKHNPCILLKEFGSKLK